MKRLFLLALLGGLAVLLLGACGGPAAVSLSFGPAPWSDGEVSVYDVSGRDGATLGTAQWAWHRTSEGWTQTYDLNLSGRADHGEVVVSPDLRPLRSSRMVGGNSFATDYGLTAITITTTDAAGQVVTKTLKPPADAIDNDVSLQIQRALPLAAGYVTRYDDVIPTSGAVVPIRLSVTGAETLTVPAGTFPAWHVVIDAGSVQQDAWYGQDAPHALLKYVNRTSGATFVLRSIGEGAASAAQPAPQPGTAAAGEGPVTIKVPLLITSLAIQMPLMVIFPLLLGWWVRRRYGIGWGIFGAGVLSFIGSQVVHLPLNYALGLLGGGRGVALWPLPLLAAVAGLSAGVCEEGARWIILRFFARRARGWRAALQFGAGHGGAESIIFGLLALISLLAMVAVSTLDASALKLPAQTVSQLDAARSQYWNSPWYLPIVSGVERLFAISIQLALTQVVMLSFTRKNIAYLLAAIGFHAIVDFWAVWAAAILGTAWVEVGVAVFAAFALGLVWRLRDGPLAPPDVPPSTGAPSAADFARRQLSSEELAKRSDESRYE